MAYDPAVWYGLVLRMTADERERLRELSSEVRHYPPNCLFVRSVKAGLAFLPWRLSDEWIGVAAEYEGEETRFSARFRDPCGTQSVARGEEPCGSWHQQSNGGRRLWQSVSGEIESE